METAPCGRVSPETENNDVKLTLKFFITKYLWLCNIHIFYKYENIGLKQANPWMYKLCIVKLSKGDFAFFAEKG